MIIELFLQKQCFSGSVRDDCIIKAPWHFIVPSAARHGDLSMSVVDLLCCHFLPP